MNSKDTDFVFSKNSFWKILVDRIGKILVCGDDKVDNSVLELFPSTVDSTRLELKNRSANDEPRIKVLQ